MKRLEFIGAERMVGVTGREIFQKERVDKDDQGGRQRTRAGNGQPGTALKVRESSYSLETDGGKRERKAARLADREWF